MIRTARADDAAAVRAMSTDLSRRGPLPQDVFDAQLGAALADARSVVLVADDGEQLAGYALGFVAPMLVHEGIGFLQELYVRPGRRGQGVGAALVATFERAALGRGATVVALATARAGGFYARLGYEGGAAYLRREIAAGGGPDR